MPNREHANTILGSPLVATEAIGSVAKLCDTTDAVATSGDPTYRKYPRATFHDYNGGAYFVTVCTKNKVHSFGTIKDDKMHLSPLGNELKFQLENTRSHYADVEIPSFVVMPNHFHAIIIVGSPLVATEARLANNLGRLNQTARLTVATSGDPTLTTHHGSRLGKIISAVKAAVTRFARHNNIEFDWQSRFHDHIIRGPRDGNRISQYIVNNVARWTNDCFYTNGQCSVATSGDPTLANRNNYTKQRTNKL